VISARCACSSSINTMREAVAATGADAVLSAVPTERALDAVFEVVEAGIRLMVLYSENVPLHDAVRMRAYALARGMRLLGPNSAGVISPGKANLADINDVNVVAANAKFLNGNASRKVRLEGHSDERGSREYNIGLGERRAQAVRRALMLQGVTESQITTVSYGEERPAVQGSDESAYSKNRRVELSYGR